MNKNDFIKFLSAFELSQSKITKILDALNGEYSFEKFCFDDQIEKILGDDYTSISRKSNQKYFDSYLARLEEKGIKLLTCEDENYPEKFDKIEDKPYYIFYKGDISLLSLPSVGIVGTRSPSNYGCVVTERFAKDLASAGAVIISGLAYGVDSIAHRQALAVNGKTVAVLAGGFDNVYPSEHHALFDEIAEKGLVISEHRPDIKSLKFNFIHRNRLVAALSDALLITEAGAKSGTTITKDFALDYGVPIYAIPGNITSSKSDGTNNLIATMQGICLINSENLISDLGLECKKSAVMQLSINEQMVIDALSLAGRTIDELQENTKLPISKLNSLLTSLEIKGIIKRMPGGIFMLG